MSDTVVTLRFPTSETPGFLRMQAELPALIERSARLMDVIAQRRGLTADEVRELTDLLAPFVVGVPSKAAAVDALMELSEVEFYAALTAFLADVGKAPGAA